MVQPLALSSSERTRGRHTLLGAPHYVACGATYLANTCRPARNVLRVLPRRIAGGTCPWPNKLREIRILREIDVESSFVLEQALQSL